MNQAKRLKRLDKERSRLKRWLADGLWLRIRPAHEDHAWSCDFFADCTQDGRVFRMLARMVECTRECLAIDVARKLKGGSVLKRLSNLFARRLVCELVTCRRNRRPNHFSNLNSYTLSSVADTSTCKVDWRL